VAQIFLIATQNLVDNLSIATAIGGLWTSILERSAQIGQIVAHVVQARRDLGIDVEGEVLETGRDVIVVVVVVSFVVVGFVDPHGGWSLVVVVVHADAAILWAK
jgi:hypothetical protein